MDLEDIKVSKEKRAYSAHILISGEGELEDILTNERTLHIPVLRANSFEVSQSVM